jgi:DNA polymerase-3 subunit delta
MRLRFGQFTDHLKRALQPVYLIAGEEPWQCLEAVALVRECARARGYAERVTLTVEPGFDWGEFNRACVNLSLFAERRIIELRIPGGKPDTAGAKTLAAYAKQPTNHNVLVIQTGKLDPTQLNSAWFKAVDRAGIVLQVWRLSARETRAWIVERLRENGFQPEEEAVAVLAAKVEGNLLCAAQEIEKLTLLWDSGPLDTASMLEAVADSSRFRVFDLTDATLGGDTVRAINILDGLRIEDVKPPLILWVLAEQVRELLEYSFPQREAEPARATPLRGKRHRETLIKRALSRYSYGQWSCILRRCAEVDKVIKGAIEKDKVWDELLQLVTAICGKKLFDKGLI